ncbi:MAG TPA: methylmalonyl-CoA mutase family protein [Acidobacteriota bacterium]|nr:methylmalonyl-CoA mutase family protein [Acidobacteriota bacterium]
MGDPANRKPRFETSFRQEIKNHYEPGDLGSWDYSQKLGDPGEYPYTRGIQPEMYRTRFWTMRQYAGFGSAEDTNRRFRYLLSQGQTGLSTAFDLPTQMGYDSDHPLARGEVGRVGVAIDSLEDMERLLDGIPLEKVSTSMTINATAFILLGLYICVAKKRGVPLDQISGTVQNDILKEYIARGTYIYPPEFSLKLVTDVMQFCGAQVPRWNTISISGYHIREAGSDAVQEVAFTLANALTYVQAALNAGLKIDDFAPRISFFFASHNHLFEEVAKFRAARRLWARLMKDRFAAKSERSWQMRFHTQTAGSTLTAQQPQVNITRVTLQALAAVLGGTQSLHTNAWDEALALPTEASALLALRTQQVIGNESGAADTADPLGGSYYIEHMTDVIDSQATEYLKRIEGLGGMLKAIESGFVMREIQESAYRYARALEDKQELVVGVNTLQADEEPIREILRIDPQTEEDQIARVKALRKRRDQRRVDEKLSAIGVALDRNQNIMPPLIEALLNLSTLGEVSEMLRKRFGEYKEMATL